MDVTQRCPDDAHLTGVANDLRYHDKLPADPKQDDGVLGADQTKHVPRAHVPKGLHETIAGNEINQPS